jgi:hypothetical protein
MSNAKLERKYALTKVAPGDYLLPSNDGCTIWRIARYEDGPSKGLDIPRDREFWGVWRWAGAECFVGYVDTGDWSRWNMVESGCDTRAEAIREALRVG